MSRSDEHDSPNIDAGISGTPIQVLGIDLRVLRRTCRRGPGYEIFTVDVVSQARLNLRDRLPR